jgi:hypothetical protein
LRHADKAPASSLYQAAFYLVVPPVTHQALSALIRSVA